MGNLNEKGAWVFGAPLESTGRLLCEKKEPSEGVVGDDDISIGGYMVLQAESYDAVLELCTDCPTFEVGGKLKIREACEM
jgi:hypothetical protein